MLYWVVIKEVPTKKDKEENGTLDKIVVQPVCVEARDDKDAALRVALDNEVVKGIDRERLQVVVCPF